MFRKYLLPLLALAGIILAIRTVIAQGRPVPPAQPVSAPAENPFAASITGSGLVEASTENIAIGTNVAGVITRVDARPGDDVSAGAPLFSIDDRSLASELAVRRAALAGAEARLAKLAGYPRAEDLPPAEAKVSEAQATLSDLKSQLSMWDSVTDRRAVSEDERSRRRYAVQVGEARLAQAQADLALLRAGAWAPDLEIARSDADSARALLHATEIEIERLTVRAPVAGRVLQLKVRPGEFAPTGVLAQPLILLGDVATLHVRVDIDENDAWRLKPGAKARASVRGNKDLWAWVAFVRAEPYVIPKKSLTGDSTERVDTRVLQVLYRFSRADLPVYVGQQLDVQIEADPVAPRAPGAGAAAGRRGAAE